MKFRRISFEWAISGFFSAVYGSDISSENSSYAEVASSGISDQFNPLALETDI